MTRDPIAAWAIAALVVDRLTSYWLCPEIVRESVPIVEIVGGLGEQVLGSAHGKTSGRRLLRLEYAWSDLEAEVYRSKDDFVRDVLPTLVTEGAIIRARLRAARRGTEMRIPIRA